MCNQALNYSSQKHQKKLAYRIFWGEDSRKQVECFKFQGIMQHSEFPCYYSHLKHNKQKLKNLCTNEAWTQNET